MRKSRSMTPRLPATTLYQYYRGVIVDDLRKYKDHLDQVVYVGGVHDIALQAFSRGDYENIFRLAFGYPDLRIVPYEIKLMIDWLRAGRNYEHIPRLFLGAIWCPGARVAVLPQDHLAICLFDDTKYKDSWVRNLVSQELVVEPQDSEWIYFSRSDSQILRQYLV